MKMVVANWKMNFLRRDAEEFLEKLLASYRPKPNMVAAIAPPMTLLDKAGRLLAGTQVGLYAQNASDKPMVVAEGAQFDAEGMAHYFEVHKERLAPSPDKGTWSVRLVRARPRREV